MKRSINNGFVQTLMLAMAVLPAVIAVAIVIHSQLHGSVAELQWKNEFWPIVVLQVASISLFMAHAMFNKDLTDAEHGHWAFRFVVYIPFGMIEYWRKYVWR